jgi:hypothetical protein
VFVTWQGRRPFRPLGDLDDRRVFMRRHGVAMQVLSLASLFGIDCLPIDESAPLVSASGSSRLRDSVGSDEVPRRRRRTVSCADTSRARLSPTNGCN